MKSVIEDFDELVEFLKGQGHSPDRSKQIAGNHPDAVRAMCADKSKGVSDAEKEKATPSEGATETEKSAPPAQEERAVSQT